MRRLLLVVPVLGAGLPAPTAAAKVTYCSPTGDYCTSVARAKGVRYLSVRSFAFNGRVKICVRDPRGGRVCRSFRMTKGGPAYVLSVRWRRHFPDRGAGFYRVSFFSARSGSARFSRSFDSRRVVRKGRPPAQLATSGSGLALPHRTANRSD